VFLAASSLPEAARERAIWRRALDIGRYGARLAKAWAFRLLAWVSMWLLTLRFSGPCTLRKRVLNECGVPMVRPVWLGYGDVGRWVRPGWEVVLIFMSGCLEGACRSVIVDG
jgi:hypothetical protein